MNWLFNSKLTDGMPQLQDQDNVSGKLSVLTERSEEALTDYQRTIQSMKQQHQLLQGDKVIVKWCAIFVVIVNLHECLYILLLKKIKNETKWNPSVNITKC